MKGSSPKNLQEVTRTFGDSSLSLCLEPFKLYESIVVLKWPDSDNKDNKPKFIEVNPRMGGGTVFTNLVGNNIPKMILTMAHKEQVFVKDFKEITVLRYFEEVVVEDKNV